MSYVEGSYATSQEAFAAVQRLKTEGYRAEDIRLISNEAMRDTFMNDTDVHVTTTDRYEDELTHEDESLWEKIKNAFTLDDEYSYDSDNDPLANYRTDIEAGKIVVLVEGESKRVDERVDLSRDRSDERTHDEETIQLKEERLDVETKEVQTGEVHVSKRVVKETETIEVPVEHEEIVIERHPVDGDEKVSGNMTLEDDEITIPVTEEQIEVTKEPVITEEVIVGKEKVTDTKQVKEQVEKEKLDIDSDGDVELDDQRTTRDDL